MTEAARPHSSCTESLWVGRLIQYSRYPCSQALAAQLFGGPGTRPPTHLITGGAFQDSREAL
jgi:hypothetical protein